MILNHLNHKMPIYKDCTLGEMLGVGFIAFIVMSAILSLLTRWLFGYGFIGFAAALLSLVHITRFLLGKLQKIKLDKPYGYYQQLFLKTLAQYSPFKFFLKLPYLQTNGKWSIRRRI